MDSYPEKTIEQTIYHSVINVLTFLLIKESSIEIRLEKFLR